MKSAKKNAIKSAKKNGLKSALKSAMKNEIAQASRKAIRPRRVAVPLLVFAFSLLAGAAHECGSEGSR